MDIRDVATRIYAYGCVGNHGQRIYGTAALLHYLRIMERPVRDIDPCLIDAGRQVVEKILAA